MKEKIEIIKGLGKVLCLLSIIFGILNIIPSLFGAPGEAIAFYLVTAIFPLGLGLVMIFTFFKFDGDLYKLHTRVLHIAYIDISMAITIILLAFTPRINFSPVAAIFNVIASLGLGITGIWILLSSYKTTRYSIIP